MEWQWSYKRARSRLVLTASWKGLYFLILASSLCNRLALSVLLMTSCSKFRCENLNHSDDVLSVSCTISLELTAGHSKKYHYQRYPSSHLVCPGFPVESSTLSGKKVCLCVAVECRRMHINREIGGRRGGGKRAWKIQETVLLIY